MTPKIFKKSISYMAIIIFVILFVVSAFADSSNSIKIAKDNELEHGQIKKRYKHHNGPPDHAPAHGYRAKYQYRYYPRCSVYRDAAREVYFYLKGENWEVGLSLPSHLINDLGEYVSLDFGHYGGEEFIILPRGKIDKENVFNQCEHIRKAVEKFEFCHAEACLRLTISIGFHLSRPDNGKVESLLNGLIYKADHALYLSKEKGKNRTQTLL